MSGLHGHDGDPPRGERVDEDARGEGLAGACVGPGHEDAASHGRGARTKSITWRPSAASRAPAFHAWPYTTS